MTSVSNVTYLAPMGHILLPQDIYKNFQAVAIMLFYILNTYYLFKSCTFSESLSLYTISHP